MQSFKFLAAFVCASVAVDLAACAAESGSPTWRHDFRAAEAEAKHLHRPLLVHFHAKWCGPCQMMNREVLSDPVVLKQLQATVVAVKIDSDEHPDLAKRLNVETLPTDVFLDPSGYVLDRSTGLRSLQSYLSLVARVDARFAQSRKTQCMQTERPLREPVSLSRSTPPPIAPSPIRQPTSGRPLVASITTQMPTHPTLRLRASKRPSASIGLRGYSPVALIDGRQWARGNERWAWEYKGVVYHMASAAELRKFQDSADRYAPQVMGCDPVILDITDRAVMGDIRYAAFFEGELYLFVSEKSRQTFRQDPERFVRTKHVLNVDELDDKRLE